jgi:hypothetical protein
MIKRFYETETEFEDFYIRLKLIMCPHCNTMGCLIRHGYLYGYSETDTSSIKRGHRIYCSNRHQKKGCGRTFSVLASGFLKNFMISATSLWCFLLKIAEGLSFADAFRETGSLLREASPYRFIRKFKHNQVRIRTLLTGIKDPPVLNYIRDPVIQTILHLKYVFDQSPCPISSFQHFFQTSFF